MGACDGDDIWDPLFEETGLTNSADKEKFLEICRTSEQQWHESMTNFNDLKAFASLLVQTGLLNLNNDNDDDRQMIPSFMVGTDGVEGRITSLHSFPSGTVHSSNTVVPYRNVPRNIVRLDRLEALYIDRAKSLPLKELSLLPNLYVLSLSRCSDGLSEAILGAPKSINFPNVKRLHLHGSSSFPMLHRCISVEKLVFNCEHPKETDGIIHFLSSDTFASLKTLQCIHFDGRHAKDGESPMNEIHLETLMFEILPNIANIDKLILHTVLDLSTLKALMDRIGNDKERKLPKSLRKIHFYFRPEPLESTSNDPSAKKTLMTFLDVFDSVEQLVLGMRIGVWKELDFRFGKKLITGTDLKYSLVRNRVGRSLLKYDGAGKNSIPLSLWPFVFEKAQKKFFYEPSTRSSSDDMTTGMYYLLREGPALLGRNMPDCNDYNRRTLERTTMASESVNS